MLRALTRFPSTKFPQNLLTQVPVFDDYLQRLDTELLGRASLRKVTLEEVRDHLLEQQAALIAEGLASDVAAQQALEDFGLAQEIGREQRREKTADFVKNIFLFGLPYAVLMAVFSLISDLNENPQTFFMLTIIFAFHLVFFGLFMSFFLTFSDWRGGVTKAQASAVANTDETDVIEVYALKANKILAGIMLTFGFGVLVLCILGILGVGIGRYYGVLGGLFMLYISLIMIAGMSRAWTQTRLQGNQLAIKTVFSKSHYTIASVKEFTRVRLWQAYWPLISGNSHKLTFISDNNDERTLYLALNPADMQAGDQLIAHLESLKASPQAAG